MGYPQFTAPLIPCNLPVKRCPVSREAASHRILVMRLGAYGDILMGTPLLAALREAYPKAHLTWLAGATERQAIDANPFLDELIHWEGDYFRFPWRHGNPLTAIRRSLAFRQELHRRRYDIFVSFQPEEWPLLTFGVGATQKIGIFNTFARHWGEERNPHFQRLYTQTYSHPDKHRIDQYLMTLEALGLPPAVSRQMSIGYTREDAASVENFLARQGIANDEALIVLAPSTTWPTKCWPPERYAELGNRLTTQRGCRIVVIGSGSEQETIEALASLMTVPPVVAAGTLTFRQVAALISRAALLVSGDTGPMHLATALGTPQIALFGSTSPQWYGPMTGQAISLMHPVPCGPCDQKFCRNTGSDEMLCMKLVTVDEAEAAANQLLDLVPARL